jgi:hypothetical protein
MESAKDAVDRAILKILTFSEISRKQGILAMIPALDKRALEDRNNLFEYGLALVCSGTSSEVIEGILQNIKDVKDPSFTQKILDTLFITGVLNIQAGYNSEIIILLLDSHVPEQCRSDWLKQRVTEINMKSVNEEGLPRVYLHPEETEIEFEKIAILSDRQVQTLMRDCDTDTLVWAVRGNEKMRGVFYHNMSGRAAEIMEDDFKYIKEGRTIEAQQRILDAAKRLGFI